MVKLATAIGTAALLALGAGSLGSPKSDCSVTVTEEGGQVIEQVVCNDGSSLEIAHMETHVRERDGE